jgi:hypothetical protein
VNVRFKHKKIVCVLKYKLFIHWFNVFSLPRLFLELPISHP